jgi:hypothetical protein
MSHTMHKELDIHSVNGRTDSYKKLTLPELDYSTAQNGRINIGRSFKTWV